MIGGKEALIEKKTEAETYSTTQIEELLMKNPKFKAVLEDVGALNPNIPLIVEKVGKGYKISLFFLSVNEKYSKYTAADVSKLIQKKANEILSKKGIKISDIKLHAPFSSFANDFNANVGEEIASRQSPTKKEPPKVDTSDIDKALESINTASEVSIGAYYPLRMYLYAGSISEQGYDGTDPDKYFNINPISANEASNIISHRMFGNEDDVAIGLAEYFNSFKINVNGKETNLQNLLNCATNAKCENQRDANLILNRMGIPSDSIAAFKKFLDNPNEDTYNDFIESLPQHCSGLCLNIKQNFGGIENIRQYFLQNTKLIVKGEPSKYGINFDINLGSGRGKVRFTLDYETGNVYAYNMDEHGKPIGKGQIVAKYEGAGAEFAAQADFYKTSGGRATFILDGLAYWHFIHRGTVTYEGEGSETTDKIATNRAEASGISGTVGVAGSKRIGENVTIKGVILYSLNSKREVRGLAINSDGTATPAADLSIEHVGENKFTVRGELDVRLSKFLTLMLGTTYTSVREREKHGDLNPFGRDATEYVGGDINLKIDTGKATYFLLGLGGVYDIKKKRAERVDFNLKFSTPFEDANVRSDLNVGASYYPTGERKTMNVGFTLHFTSNVF